MCTRWSIGVRRGRVFLDPERLPETQFPQKPSTLPPTLPILLQTAFLGLAWGQWLYSLQSLCKSARGTRAHPGPCCACPPVILGHPHSPHKVPGPRAVLLSHGRCPPCLSAALTSAPRSRRRCRQGRRSGSSLARSRGLLSWIWAKKAQPGWPGRLFVAPSHTPHFTVGWTGSYPVPPVDVSPVAHQQLHHVGLVAQDSDVQGRVVGDWV